MSTKTEAPTWPYRTNTPPHEAAQGWHRVERADVYRRGDRLVVVGVPKGEEEGVPDDHPMVHNCDDMGCPSVGGHNVIIATVDRPRTP